MGLARQYKGCNFGLTTDIQWSIKRRGEVHLSLKWRQRSAGLSSEGRDPQVIQADLSAPRVCSPDIALFHKKDPCHRRKICANSLWLYSYDTQSSPWKNKNVKYIFMYLRVLRCLSSSAICGTNSSDFKFSLIVAGLSFPTNKLSKP